MKNTKIFMIALIILLMGSAIFAQDSANTTEEKSKFPGVLGIEFLQRVDHNSRDFSTINSDMLIGDAAYTRTELKLSLKFPIKIFSITPWVKERFEVRLNPTADFRARNRVYLGLNNVIAIPNVMNIGINFESRFEADFYLNGSATSISTRFAPILSLSGKYKFGLSWYATQYFEFYIVPVELYNANGMYETFDQVDFEGFYGIGFEFFHFIPAIPKEIKCEIAFDQYLLIRSQDFTPDFDDTDQFVNKLYSESFAGVKFNIYGMTPFVGAFIFVPFADIILPKPVVGLKTGIGYTKEWFTIGVSYIGGMAQGPLADSNDRRWQNNVSVFIKIKK